MHNDLAAQAASHASPYPWLLIVLAVIIVIALVGTRVGNWENRKRAERKAAK